MHPPNSILRWWCMVTVAAAVLLPGTAKADVHELKDPNTGADSGWVASVDPDAVWPIGVVVDEVNDDAVIIQIKKTFLGSPDEYGLMAAMFVEFLKKSEDAVGKIIITDEFVTNDTTEDWIDYHMVLMVSENVPEAGFSNDSDPDGDQFSTVVLSDSNGYNGLPTILTFRDGLVPMHPTDLDDFQPGFASGSIIIVTDPNLPADPTLLNAGQIVLKQYPTIPEPTTLALLLLGGLALLKRRK